LIVLRKVAAADGKRDFPHDLPPAWRDDIYKALARFAHTRMENALKYSHARAT